MNNDLSFDVVVIGGGQACCRLGGGFFENPTLEGAGVRLKRHAPWNGAADPLTLARNPATVPDIVNSKKANPLRILRAEYPGD